jgi:hypothetical protein
MKIKNPERSNRTGLLLLALLPLHYTATPLSKLSKYKLDSDEALRTATPYPFQHHRQPLSFSPTKDHPLFLF